MKKIFLIIPVMLIACVPTSYTFYLKRYNSFAEVCDKFFDNGSCRYEKISEENKYLPFIEYSHDGKYTYFTNGKIIIRIKPSNVWLDFNSVADYTPEETRHFIEEKMQIEAKNIEFERKNRESMKQKLLLQKKEKIKFDFSGGLPKETNHKKILEEFYRIKKNLEKDEFETTESYKKRRKKITDGLFKKFRKIYIYSGLDASYDADKKSMSIKPDLSVDSVKANFRIDSLDASVLSNLLIIRFNMQLTKDDLSFSERTLIFKIFLKKLDVNQSTPGTKLGLTDISTIIYRANDNLSEKIDIYDIDTEKARRIKKHSKLLISAHLKNDDFSFFDIDVKTRGVIVNIDIDYACILDIEQRKCVYIFDTRPEE